MSNPLEEGRQRPAGQDEMEESYREIFTTAIKLLETRGKLSAKNFFNGYQRYQVFQHAVDYPRQDAINVKIVAGADLEKAKKVSIHVGLFRLDVRKKGVEGREKHKGQEFNVDFGHGEDLNGGKSFHIVSVRKFLEDIRRVSSDIMPQSH